MSRNPYAPDAGAARLDATFGQPKPGVSTGLVVVIALVAALLGLICGGAIGGFVGYGAGVASSIASSLKAPESLLMSVAPVAPVKPGDTVTLAVTVTNTGAAAQKVETIDLADELVQGLLPGSTISPAPTGEEHSNAGEYTEYTFGTPLAPGQSVTFTFVFKAGANPAGRGDVDVWFAGAGLLTTTVQIVSAGEAPANAGSKP